MFDCVSSVYSLQLIVLKLSIATEVDYRVARAFMTFVIIDIIAEKQSYTKPIYKHHKLFILYPIVFCKHPNANRDNACECYCQNSLEE